MMKSLMMYVVVMAVACVSMPALANVTAFMPTVCDSGIDSAGTSFYEYVLPTQGYLQGLGSYGSTRRSFIMFDLSSIPDNAQILSAAFGACVININPGTYNSCNPSTGVFYVEDDSWNEETINWDNAPSASYGGDYQATLEKNKYYEWDILNGTDFQWNWMPDLYDNNITLMLMSEFENINNWAKFYSSEAPGNKPYLRIEYAVPTVPEPTTMTLALIGLGSTAYAIRKRKL